MQRQGKTESLLTEKPAIEGKKGVHLLSKGVNPGGREEGIGGCAVYQHKGSKSGCQCEERTGLNSCPGHIRGITDSVFPWENGNTLSACPLSCCEIRSVTQRKPLVNVYHESLQLFPGSRGKRDGRMFLTSSNSRINRFFKSWTPRVTVSDRERLPSSRLLDGQTVKHEGCHLHSVPKNWKFQLVVNIYSCTAWVSVPRLAGMFSLVKKQRGWCM